MVVKNINVDANDFALLDITTDFGIDCGVAKIQIMNAKIQGEDDVGGNTNENN